MATAAKLYEDVIELDPTGIDTQDDVLSEADTTVQSPSVSLSSSDTHVSSAHSDPAKLTTRKRWSSSLTSWRSRADISSLVHQGVEWAQAEVRHRAASTIAGIVDVHGRPDDCHKGP